MLGQDACFRHDGHEGVVSVPARHKVHMKMFPDPGAGRLAYIYADIDSVGIEFSPELCAIAHNNIKIVEQATGSRLDISVIEGDVTHYEIKDDQNVFFFFNPFDDVVLEAVVKNIKKSLQRKPREIAVIYYNPVHSHILDNAFLPKNGYIIGGEEYMLYANC